MRRWWHDLAPRDRRILIAGAVALAVIAWFFGLWLPPRQAGPALHDRLAAAETDLAWMRAHAGEAEALRQRRQAGGAEHTDPRAVYVLVEESARQAGLGEALERIEPAGNAEARVTLNGAAFDGLVPWLAGLRDSHGIQAGSASFRATGTPGRVDARLVLQGPSP
ncbi:Type II secretion system protein M [wastewater metagenome]|uniref:Type II secretion system protein M n=2 Tax=unclassified sequences TaxID=12908 RepID=A0A5B8RIM5_9ZZZZ|nr:MULTISPECIES: type II secretion system protein M [Arhodomonas]MCS4502986.1 type II secretion system protein M [Arhodomonas aquaeolei]QEA07838.1 type II secretion system protein M [uncultured organism]